MVIPQFSFFQGFEEVLQQALVASPWSTQIQGCSWCPNLINERLWPPQLCLQVAVKISEVFGSVGDFPCLSPLSCVCGCAHIPTSSLIQGRQKEKQKPLGIPWVWQDPSRLLFEWLHKQLWEENKVCVLMCSTQGLTQFGEFGIIH